VETASSNITSPSPRLDQPHTSDCVELPSLECGVQATGITRLGLVAHPSAAHPSMYEAGCVSRLVGAINILYMWQTIAQGTEAAPTADRLQPAYPRNSYDPPIESTWRRLCNVPWAISPDLSLVGVQALGIQKASVLNDSP